MRKPKKYKSASVAHRKLASLAVGAARMNRDVAIHADTKMGERIERAFAQRFPRLRLGGVFKIKRDWLDKTSVQLAAVVLADFMPGQTLQCRAINSAAVEVRQILLAALKE